LQPDEISGVVYVYSWINETGGRCSMWLICRVAALIAAVFYWVGVTLHAPTTREAKFVGPIEECYVLKGGIFVRAAVLSLVATSLGIMSCVLLRLPAATTDVTVEGQHAVGLPEWQAPNPEFAPSLLLLLLLRVRRTLQYCSCCTSCNGACCCKVLSPP
jgi:hypothetical protein